MYIALERRKLPNFILPTTELTLLQECWNWLHYIWPTYSDKLRHKMNLVLKKLYDFTTKNCFSIEIDTVGTKMSNQPKMVSCTCRCFANVSAGTWNNKHRRNSCTYIV